MITQFAPVIQKSEDGNSGVFGDVTRSEHRVLDGGWQTGSGRTDLVSPESYPIFSISPEENLGYYHRLFMTANSILELYIRDQKHNWREMLNIDHPSYSTGSVALEAVEYLKSLLKMSEITVANLVDISRNTIRNWRNGQGAYPSTVRKLFQVKHLISALHTTMTRERLNIWLYEPDDYNPNLSRLGRLGQPDGVGFLTKQANHLLFPPRPGKMPPQEMLVLESDLAMEEPGYAPNFYKTRSRYDDLREKEL